MRSSRLLLGLTANVVSASLSDVCTVSYVQSVLPADNFIEGITLLPDSVTVNAVTNYSVTASDQYPGKDGLDFCNVTVAYTYTSRDDTTNLWFWLPSSSQFQNRYLSTGGGGLAITSGQRGLAAGLPYGAVTATTDGGFGGWDKNLSNVLLLANGTMNLDMLYAFAYKAIHEMTVLGKELTRQFYGQSDFYSYYQGCSEGGREGWSQAQRYGDQFDGVSLGAPAFRQAFQQVNHLFSAVVEYTLGYAPPPCELDKINNDTIAACDGLDGVIDGVVSRTDLCKLHYNSSASIGSSYSCAASPNAPASNGTVTAEGVAVAQAIVNGLFDSKGRQVYVSYQPSATFADATTVYNSNTGEYEVSFSGIVGIGVQFINQFLKEIDSSELDLTNATYDTLRDWILEAMQKYDATLQTTWPDLEDAYSSGAKIIHWHGEADNSVPAGASTIYYDSVRRIMYPGMGFNESYDSLHKFYRLFLVPGAGHCSPNAYQPAPFPQNVLGSLIDWVENGVNPTTLNATMLSGPNAGAEGKICSFPLRPYWSDNNTMECVYDQESIDSWLPTLDSIPLPVY